MHVVGIDLGTTNCAAAAVDREVGDSPPVRVLPLTQITHPGEVEERLLLPSFLYLPSAHEFKEGALGLPWHPRKADAVVGELARSHGALVPGRLVHSAKSWLCFAGVDRRAAVLPWQAAEDVPKISPLGAAARYLAHIREAWDHQAGKEKSARLAAQEVVLTVPASFDPVARELTVEAAREAGLGNVILLEEPQAAIYAWLERTGDAWRKELRVGDVLLVVDVGGGTTDLSLVAVVEEQGALALHRVAVGDHILLGGDNMDLALAHAVAARLQPLDAWQMSALTHACREAKERLFADPALAAHPLVVPSRGSSLVRGSIKAQLTREELVRILVDGFFPRAGAADRPAVARRVGPSTSLRTGPSTSLRTGLTQLGLPYAQDPGITRHLAAFLGRHARALDALAGALPQAAGRSFLHPTAVLFNGGVFKARELEARAVEVLGAWIAAEGGRPPRVLQGADLDLAVARGAAYFGRLRHGKGLRIRGGTARSYYVGIETSMPAVPGMPPPVKALCVAPFGMEEGTQAEIGAQEFGLVVGEPAEFRFFSSSVRRADQVGAVVERWPEGELTELPPLVAELPGEPGQVVPVRLTAAVTEIGTLQIGCVERGGQRSHRLELSVRQGE